MKRVCTIGFAMLAVALAVTGCSEPPLVPVSGTVKFDGKPIAGATVTFLPASVKGKMRWVARGTTDERGVFQLRSRGNKDGIPAGLYKVTLSSERPDVEGAEIFPAEYHDADQTILAVTVPEGGTQFDFEAKPMPKPKNAPTIPGA